MRRESTGHERQRRNAALLQQLCNDEACEPFSEPGKSEQSEVQCDDPGPYGSVQNHSKSRFVSGLKKFTILSADSR